ncbi:MAG: MBL fold metallo-hydrolase, partial [Novosphingobium sp.]
MYCKLLGDCFLITVTPIEGPRAHILIDCGVLQGTPGGGERMKAVAADIAATCRDDGRDTLDLAVVTHEHWDHVSGFRFADEIFAELGFDQLWLAWTEDPA